MVLELKLNLSDSLADEAKSLRIVLTPNVTGVYRLAQPVNGLPRKRAITKESGCRW